MKVFDFTSGQRGEQLAEIKRAEWTGGNLVKKDGHTYRVTLAGRHGGPEDDWAWCTSAGHTTKDGDVPLDPKAFGVEAICFCLGEWYHTWHKGHPEAESQWEWRVLGTKEWNRQACKSGILKAERVK